MLNWELSDWLVDALNERGYHTPTQIQSEAIPVIRAGKDVLAGSETGSGKTLAFGLPALEMIDVEQKGVEVLVVCPTRELAVQVTDDIKVIAKHKEGANVVPIYGGADFVRQLKLVKKGAKIIVSTPGRLLDHINRNTIKLNKIKMVVLDEADEMLNMGFKPDIDKILSSLNKETQVVMFSATISEDIKKITSTYQKSAVHIQIGQQNSPIHNVKQYFCNVGLKDKKSTVLELMSEYENERKLIFCNTKRMTETLANLLKDNEYKVLVLNGDMSQHERKETMKKFKAQGANTMIATDVAGRGIDVKDLTLVINFDMPLNDEPYIHRIGRTGRAGKTGVAITILNNGDQLNRLKTLCNNTETELTEKIVSYSVKIKATSKKSGNNKSTRGKSSSSRSYGGKKSSSSYKGKSSSSYKGKSYSRDDKRKNGTEDEKKSYKKSGRYGEKSEKSRYGERSEKSRYGEKSSSKRDYSKSSKKSYGSKNREFEGEKYTKQYEKESNKSYSGKSKSYKGGKSVKDYSARPSKKSYGDKTKKYEGKQYSKDKKSSRGSKSYKKNTNI